jgi:hypothetical protein
MPGALGPADTIAKGFEQFGPYVWGLSLALAVLAIVSWLLLRAKDAQIREGKERERDLTLQLVSAHKLVGETQEKRIADRDTFQGKLEALARETNETSNEMIRAMSELARKISEGLPRRRQQPPSPKEAGGE